MAAIADTTVAESLRAEATRNTTLDALEALTVPISNDVARAAAPALVDVACGPASRMDVDRSALLLARLLAEAAPDPTPLYGAAFGGKRRLAAIFAPRLMVEAAQRALASAAEGGHPLTSEDARSYACLYAHMPPAWARGYTAPLVASGLKPMDLFGVVS